MSNVTVAHIVSIKKNGKDGARLPIQTKIHSYRIGRGADCEISIQLPEVCPELAIMTIDENHCVWIKNISEASSILINEQQLIAGGNKQQQVDDDTDSICLLHNQDIIKIASRAFRLDYGQISHTWTAELRQLTINFICIDSLLLLYSSLCLCVFCCCRCSSCHESQHGEQYSEDCPQDSCIWYSY